MSFERLTPESTAFSARTIGRARSLEPLLVAPGLESVRLPKSKRLDISALEQLPRLRELSMEAVTPAQLEVINRLPALEHLRLNGKGRQLEGLARPLRRLDLVSTSIHDDVFVAAGCEGLEELRLGNNYSDLSDERPLPELPELRRIHILSNRQRSLAHLAHLPKLEEVYATSQNTLTSCTGLEGKPLRVVSFYQSGVSSVAPLIGAPLRLLDISSCPFTDLDELAHFPKLRVLKAAYNRIRDIAGLAGLRELQGLNLSYPREPVADPSPIATLTALRELHLGTDALDYSFLEGLSELEVLQLYDARLDDLEIVLGLPKLVIARLGRCPAMAEAGAREELEAAGLNKGYHRVEISLEPEG